MPIFLKSPIKSFALIYLLFLFGPMQGMHQKSLAPIPLYTSLPSKTSIPNNAPAFHFSVSINNHGITTSHPASQLRAERASRKAAQKPVTSNLRMDWIQLQMAGDKASLKKIRRDLKQELKHAYFGRKKLLQEKIDFLTTLIKSPLTKTLHTIKYGSFSEALSVLRKIENKFCYNQIITDPATIKELALARKANGFDCVDAAHAIFKSRADYDGSIDTQPYKSNSLTKTQAMAKSKTTKDYVLSKHSAEFLTLQQIDPKKFESFTGNALEHALHQRSITILNEATELHETSKNYTVKQLTQATIHYVEIGHEFNIKGSLEHAEYMINYSEATMYLAKEIATGAFQGAHLGIKATIERLCHPIDTITGIAQSAMALSTAIFDATIDMNELEILYETNVELAVARSQEMKEKYAPIREALKKQIAEMSLRDWSRVAAQVATEGFLQKKFLQTTSKLLKNLEKGTVRLMESKSLVTAEECVVTADGTVLRTGGQGNNEPTLKNINNINNRAKQLDYAHSSIQYNELKDTLRTEQFISIIKVSKHGLERLIERGFEPEEVISLLTKPTFVRIQADGSRAFIQKIADQYSILVINETTGEVITALKKTHLKKIIKLGKNYGWEL